MYIHISLALHTHALFVEVGGKNSVRYKESYKAGGGGGGVDDRLLLDSYLVAYYSTVQ